MGKTYKDYDDVKSLKAYAKRLEEKIATYEDNKEQVCELEKDVEYYKEKWESTLEYKIEMLWNHKHIGIVV